jgi:hypothetical protein
VGDVGTGAGVGVGSEGPGDGVEIDGGATTAGEGAGAETTTGSSRVAAGLVARSRCPDRTATRTRTLSTLSATCQVSLYWLILGCAESRSSASTRQRPDPVSSSACSTTRQRAPSLRGAPGLTRPDTCTRCGISVKTAETPGRPDAVAAAAAGASAAAIQAAAITTRRPLRLLTARRRISTAAGLTDEPSNGRRYKPKPDGGTATTALASSATCGVRSSTLIAVTLKATKRSVRAGAL